MDTNRETREVFLSIGNAVRYMDPFLKLTTLGAALLLQYFARMVKERKLNVKEFRDFQSFIKATDGKYDILNIPELPLEQLKEELDELGIRHMALPDLNMDDGLVQIAVYQPDKDKFAAWYERHILNRMEGGSKDFRDLRNLTSGRTSIVSMPVEGIERIRETIEEDFASLGINYARFPDLNVGDGNLQFAVANADLPKVEKWYDFLRKDLLKNESSPLEDYATITMEQYRGTGQITEEAYVQGASPEYAQANEKYEGKEKGELEKSVEGQMSFKNETSISYESYAKNPDYIPLSIDHGTLVEHSSRSDLTSFWDHGQFACRVPGTWVGGGKAGGHEYLLVLPLNQVFMKEMDGNRSYIAFLPKSEQPAVVDAVTGKAIPSLKEKSGEAFAKKYFDNVQESALKINSSLSQEREKAVNYQGMNLTRMDQMPREPMAKDRGIPLTAPLPPKDGGKEEIRQDTAKDTANRQTAGRANSFHNFEQREYDYDALEAALQKREGRENPEHLSELNSKTTAGKAAEKAVSKPKPVPPPIKLHR